MRRPDVGLFLIDQIFIEAARAHQIGVTGIIIRRHIIDKQGIGVDVAIDAPGIILGDAPLAAAQARHGDELASLVRHVPLMLGNDQQIVHPPEQTVGTMFQHAKPSETVGDLFLGIGLQIAIGIAGLPQRWRFADQRAAASQDLEGARQHQFVGKHRAIVEHAVVIGIVQHHQAIHRLKAVFHRQIVRPARQFHHPQPAIAIEFHQDRILHQRFGGDQFHGIARRHRKAVQRVNRRAHRRLFGFFGGEERPWPVQLAARWHGQVGRCQQQRCRQCGDRSTHSCPAT